MNKPAFSGEAKRDESMIGGEHGVRAGCAWWYFGCVWMSRVLVHGPYVRSSTIATAMPRRCEKPVFQAHLDLIGGRRACPIRMLEIQLVRRAAAPPQQNENQICHTREQL